MIYKMTSSKAVIAKVIADLGLNETEIPITDIRQWIGEALMNIGSVNQLDHKVEVIPINGYQAKLPCDLERLNSVAYSTCDCGGWIPMKKSTGTFSVYDRKDNCDCCNMIIHDDVLIPLVKNLHNLTKDKDALEILNKDTNTRQTLSTLINNYTVCSKMVDYSTLVLMVLISVIRHNMMSNQDILSQMSQKDMQKSHITLSTLMKMACR